MIEAHEFLEPARNSGFTFWTGVPCSYLKSFINYSIDDPELTYVDAVNEGDAVAMASGAALAGQRAVVMMQNSGLGNAVSPLSSLSWVFRLPMLLIVTLRGDPELGDEPQHELMGQVTLRMLELLDIPWEWFPPTAQAIEPSLAAACRHMDGSGRPYALVMRKGSVAPYALRNSAPAGSAVPPPAPEGRGAPARLPSRHEVLAELVASTDPERSVVIGSTGYTGRELYAVADRANHLYMVGSMGCAPALALGLALARPELRVIIADGDGAALMRMGNFATLGAYGGPGLYHLLLDNGAHESTGGQATVSAGVNFAGVAAACGYQPATEYREAGDIGRFLAVSGGPAFMHIQTRLGTPATLPRPDVTPLVVRTRLMRHLGVDAPWVDGAHEA